MRVVMPPLPFTYSWRTRGKHFVYVIMYLRPFCLRHYVLSSILFTSLCTSVHFVYVIMYFRPFSHHFLSLRSKVSQKHSLKYQFYKSFSSGVTPSSFVEIHVSQGTCVSFYREYLFHVPNYTASYFRSL
jgi:hypothetical protein